MSTRERLRESLEAFDAGEGGVEHVVDAARAALASAPPGEPTLAELRLAEISELVGPGGDGSPFGRVESMLAVLTGERDEARAESSRLRGEVERLTRERDGCFANGKILTDTVCDLLRPEAALRAAPGERERALEEAARLCEEHADAKQRQHLNPTAHALREMAVTFRALSRAPAQPCGCRYSTEGDTLHPAFFPCPRHVARVVAQGMRRLRAPAQGTPEGPASPGTGEGR